jgi:ornithine carbamoyltransferase
MVKLDLHTLRGRDFICEQDWTREELEALIQFSMDLKRRTKAGQSHYLLKDKTFFMLFYNTSTRTRASFESAMTELGGHAQFLEPETMRLGEGEAIKDTAKTLERYGHGLGIRILEKAVGYVYGKGNAVLREYAKWTGIPVINMADDKYHPCQSLCDVMTMQEKFPKIQGKKFLFSWAYSVHARSWCSVQGALLATTRFGMDVVFARPPGFDLDPEVITWCKKNADEAGGSFTVTDDLEEAYNGAHIVYPRSWMSSKCASIGIDKLGTEAEVKLHANYKHWICNSERMAKTAKNSIFMHCLPVFRGEEATDEVVDGPKSVIFDQAENRLHLQKGLLTLVMGDPDQLK